MAALQPISGRFLMILVVLAAVASGSSQSLPAVARAESTDSENSTSIRPTPLPLPLPAANVQVRDLALSLRTFPYGGGSLTTNGAHVCFSSAALVNSNTQVCTSTTATYSPSACAGSIGTYYCYAPNSTVSNPSLSTTYYGTGACFESPYAAYYNTICAWSQIQLDYSQLAACAGAYSGLYVYYCPASPAYSARLYTVCSNTPVSGITGFAPLDRCGVAANMQTCQYYCNSVLGCTSYSFAGRMNVAQPCSSTYASTFAGYGWCGLYYSYGTCTTNYDMCEL